MAPPTAPRDRKPRVYVIAGPNGAGKSTFARKFLPEYAHCKEFVNADLIAAGLSPYNPSAVAITAGRLMLERIRRLTAGRVDFGFETTLSGRRHIALLRELAESDYSVHLLYLWLPSAELAVDRVATRVKAGGHPIQEDTIRRRFRRSLKNFLDVRTALPASWLLFDNAGEFPRVVARGSGSGEEVLDAAFFSLGARGCAMSKIATKAIIGHSREALDFFRLAEEAMKTAVAQAIADHQLAGRPVFVWRDGKVQELEPVSTEHREASSAPSPL